MIYRKAYSVLDVKSFDDSGDQVTIKGVASTPRADRLGDVVEPMGAKFSVPMPLLWQHDAKKPVGRVMFAKPTKTGIPFEATIPRIREPGLLKDRVDEAIHSLKYQLVGAVSIGFQALEDAVEYIKTGQRFLRWEWIELSLVTIPANPEATITSVKSFDAEVRRALAAKDNGSSRLPQSPGAAGQLPQRTTMNSIEQRLEALQTQRNVHAERIKEINEGCNGDFTSLNKEDAAEFAELSGELKKDDVEIENAKTVQRAIGSAVEVPNVTSQQQGSRVRGGLPAEPKQKETKPEDKGIAFAQAFRIKWLAKQNGVDPRAMADHFRGKIDPRVPLFLKAAIGAGSTDGTTWGSQLVGDETGVLADFVAWLRKASIIGQFGQGAIPNIHRVPVNVPLVTATSGGNAQWVGEGKAKPLTSFAFTRTHLEPLKIAAMSAVSKELLKFSSPSADALLRDLLGGAIREREDIDFIDPDKAAVAGVSPASITNGVAQIAASGTGDAADIRTDVRALMAAFIAANNPPTTGVWIMSATSALAVGMMTNALGQPEFPGGLTMSGGSFAGLPVIVSEHVPASTSGHFVILANASDIYLWDDGPVTIDTSEHASLEMSDDPENETGTVVSMFQTNRVAFRAERFIDWLKRRASSVQVLKNANWGEA